MRKSSVDLTQDKIDLISKIIKSDRKYPNNEDLFDDFFNETCKRSVAILNAIDTEATLEAYLKRVATTSIVNVLKDSGRLRRTRAGYMSTREVLAPQSVIQKEILDFVAKTIKNIDSEHPDKNYLQIYTLRYDKGMTQKEISEELGLSQSEISKRLYRLMEKVKDILG